MEKVRYRFVYNRSGNLCVNGSALIQIEAYQNGKRKYFSTNIYIKPNQWDRTREKIRNHPNAVGLNMMIYDARNKLEAIEIELWRNGYCVKLDRLVDLARQRGYYKPERLKSDITVSALMNRYIDTCLNRPSTKFNKMTTVHLLDEFRPNLHLSEINIPFIKGFEKWMKDRGCGINTIAKHLTHLKTFLNSAVNQGAMAHGQNPFNSIKITHDSYHSSYLSPAELELLEQYSSYLERKPRDIEAKCLDAFLFCCYTGMRYSDFIRLSSANFDFRSKESWLSYRSVKTGMEVKIPLGLMFEGKGLKLIERYGNGLLEFFNLPSNAVTDRVLKKVYHKAGLEKHISFHSSRHTNATILLYKGVSVTTVQKLLGHKNIRTTMRYCAIMDQTIVRELKEYSN